MPLLLTCNKVSFSASYDKRVVFSCYSFYTVGCPVPNHLYFKAYSKKLLRANMISVLLLHITTCIIPLNNEPQFVSFGHCVVSCIGFEVPSSGSFSLKFEEITYSSAVTLRF